MKIFKIVGGTILIIATLVFICLFANRKLLEKVSDTNKEKDSLRIINRYIEQRSDSLTYLIYQLIIQDSIQRGVIDNYENQRYKEDSVNNIKRKKQ